MSVDRVRRALEAGAKGAIKRAVRGIVRRAAARRIDLPPSTWRLTRHADGALAIDGVPLAELLERWGSPLHVVDATTLAANAARFTARGCEPFVSYKTNPVPGVLRFLHARGIGAEAASPYELWLALRLGVPPQSIVYNGPSKSRESIVLAIERGVGLLNVNTRGEIALVAEIARGLRRRASIGVRVVPPGGSGGQFGERIDDGAALATFREALRHPELHVRAIHAHYNGEIASREQLDPFVSAILAFEEELRQKLGLAVEILDFGGNLACPTVSRPTPRGRRLAVTFGVEPVPRDPGGVLSIDAYVERVAERVERHFAARGHAPPRVFLEPGRALTGNAQMLLCRVIAVRDRDAAGITWAVLDAGLNVAEPLAGELHQLFAIAPRPGAKPRLHRLTGPSCTLADQLYAAWTLPALAPGDGLAIMDSGAYFVPFSTCFSFPRPAIVMLDDGREQLLRRRETFDDLVALDVGRDEGGAVIALRRPPRASEGT